MVATILAAVEGDVTKAGKAIGLALGVGLVEGLPDPLAPLVDRVLDRAERVALQHVQRDQEADDRPDHQSGDDLDQRVCCEDRGHLVPLPVTLPSFWVASTKPEAALVRGQG